MKKLVALIVFLLFIPLVLGSYISISVALTSEHAGNYTNLHVRLEQKGDEAAYKIKVVPFSSQYFEYSGDIKSEKLYPGNILEGNLIITPKRKLNGMYPFVAKIVYHDANMYPFSIISYHPIEYGKTKQSEITGIMDGGTIEEGKYKKITVRVKNTGDDKKNVKIKLYLPNELEANENEKDVTIPPSEEKKVDFIIVSKGALPKSSYNILATLEYDKEIHYTSFVTGMVKIVEKKGDSNLLVALTVLFIVLLLLFIYLKWSLRKHENIGNNSYS